MAKPNRPAACLAVHADKWLTEKYLLVLHGTSSATCKQTASTEYAGGLQLCTTICQSYTVLYAVSQRHLDVIKYVCMYRVGQKNAATDSWPQLSQILTDLGNFFTERFLSKFEVKRILNIPPHLPYVATLLCETLMSAKQAINDKLQGTVATYLRCDGVVNNQIKKGLLLSVWVKMF